MKLPVADLVPLCRRLLKYGETTADAHRGLPTRLQKRVSRSALYRFHRDLRWAVDSLARDLPAPAAEAEFKAIGDRAATATRKARRPNNRPKGGGRRAGAPAPRPRLAS